MFGEGSFTTAISAILTMKFEINIKNILKYIGTFFYLYINNILNFI
jgi:hypothetical protein